MTLCDIFIALFAVVLSDIIENKEIRLQTILNGRCMYSLEIKLDTFPNLEEILQYVHGELSHPREKQSYSVENLSYPGVRKSNFYVIPAIGGDLKGYPGQLCHYYDIFLSFESGIREEGIAMTCYFDPNYLLAEKIECMLHLYTGLLEKIGESTS